MYKIGVDLGGTKIEIILLDENLNIIQRKRVPTPQTDYQKIIHTVTTLILDTSQNISDF
ncbi:MAG: ROK family protein, partial [Nitrosopumilus sp.]